MPAFSTRALAAASPAGLAPKHRWCRRLRGPSTSTTWSWSRPWQRMAIRPPSSRGSRPKSV